MRVVAQFGGWMGPTRLVPVPNRVKLEPTQQEREWLYRTLGFLEGTLGRDNDLTSNMAYFVEFICHGDHEVLDLFRMLR